MTELIFLFAFFTGNGEQGMKLAWSEDGLNWQTVSDRYLIAPEEGLMRDPFLLRGPDKTFHLIWTTNWESQDIGYASSQDLVNWSEQRRLPVMESIPGTRNCWAPEMVYDESEKRFLIFWASTVPGLFPETAGSSETNYNHRMWSATTTDFQTLSEPSVFYDPGFNVIDATLLERDPGSYYLIVKNETLEPVAKNLFSCRAASPTGPFTEPSPPFTKSWVEGPSTLQIGDFTYVYFDQYREKRYGAVRTRDFRNWEDLSNTVSFPEDARHGSIVAIPKTEFEALRERLR